MKLLGGGKQRYTGYWPFIKYDSCSDDIKGGS